VLYQLSYTGAMWWLTLGGGEFKGCLAAGALSPTNNRGNFFSAGLRHGAHSAADQWRWQAAIVGACQSADDFAPRP